MGSPAHAAAATPAHAAAAGQTVPRQRESLAMPPARPSMTAAQQGSPPASHPVRVHASYPVAANDSSSEPGNVGLQRHQLASDEICCENFIA